MSVFEDDMASVGETIKQLNITDKTFLITGATGLVGSVITKSILHNKEENNRVIALIRNKDKAEKIFGDECGRLEFYVSDINNPINIDKHVDYIIHTASETKSKNMVSKPVETLWTSVNGTKNVLDFAVRQHVSSMVYLSSMEVYGITDPENGKISEEDLGYIDISNVRSCYPESKRLNENLCACYASEYALNVKCARLAQTFGAGVSQSETRVFAQFAKSAIEKKDIVLHTEGKSYGNYVYLSDAIRAILILLAKGKTGESYTVVNPETTMQIRDMAKMVANELTNDEIKVAFDIPEENTYGYAPNVTMHLSADKINQLGWKPKYGLLDMYKRMIAYWQDKQL
ncbi:MAG TPA: nucleotide sugar dehydratase [Lachnospiraceae bacterium]|nr:nucleotide sugar dehydratase [Lachnospiraceae bacterium]